MTLIGFMHNYNSYLANPVAIIDRQVTWYGLPYSETEFISEGKRIPTFVRPIIRFEGKYTARTVCAVLEMYTCA